MVVTPSTMPDLGTPAPDFELTDTRGETVRRGDFQGKPLLVMFICNHCPYVKHLRDHLAELTRDYMKRGVAVVGINSNDPVAYPEDSPQQMAREVEEMGYAFPYLFDATQEVARSYRAACTPDFFVYDTDHRLVYRGRYDASRPGNDEPVTGEDVSAALDGVLAGSEPPEVQMPSAGCNIKWRSGNEPDYYG